MSGITNISYCPSTRKYSKNGGGMFVHIHNHIIIIYIISK